MKLPDGTELNVKACVRLLEDAARYEEGFVARYGNEVMCDEELRNATLLRALASALPGMGKDSERLREMEAERDRVRAVHVRRHERLSAAVGLPAGYSADATIDAAIKIIVAARAAQPEETSAKHIPNLPHEWESGFPDEGVL